MPDICVVMNAGSGSRKREEKLAGLRAAFDAWPGRFELRPTEGKTLEAETDRAVADGFETIVAAGGDGTICAVAGRLRGTGRTMGVIPLGTFNYFARSLGLPEDLTEAVATIVEGEAHPARIGLVNDRTFLNNASIGAYPAILETREDIYRRYGRSRVAAYWSVLLTLARLGTPMRLAVTVDGRREDFRTPLAFIVNNAFQLEQLGLEGAERIREGDFALFVAPDDGRIGMVRHALGLATGNLKPGRDYIFRNGREIEIASRRPARLVARDGERERLASPYRFSILDDALSVMAPRSTA